MQILKKTIIIIVGLEGIRRKKETVCGDGGGWGACVSEKSVDNRRFM